MVNDFLSDLTDLNDPYACSYPGGRGVLPYIGMCRPVSFFSRFGLKTGINFEHFGLELGVVSGETFTKAYKLIFLSSNRGELLVRLKDK